MESALVPMFVVSGVLAVIGFLIKDKLDKNAKEIALLFKKHDDDAAALVDLQREIDRDHYMKHELDAKFNQLDITMREGMKALGDKFDALAKVLTEHMLAETKK